MEDVEDQLNSMFQPPVRKLGDKVDVADFMPSFDISSNTSLNMSQSLDMIMNQAAAMEYGCREYVELRQTERHVVSGLPEQRGPQWRNGQTRLGTSKLAVSKANKMQLGKLEEMAVNALEEVKAQKVMIAERAEIERQRLERERLEREAEEERLRLEEEQARLKEKEDDEAKKKTALDVRPKKKEKVEEVVVEPPGTGPLPIALIFTGQGVQTIGMMSSVQDIEVVQEMNRKALEITGWDIMDVCLNGPLELLNSHAFLQVAMLVANLASLEKLRAERPWTIKRASAVGGLSVGEYAGFVVAGMMTFEDALKLLFKRGKAMEEMVKSGVSMRMCSIVGIKREKLESICAHVSKEQGGVVNIACYLFENGYTIAGSQKEVESVEVMARKWGVQRSMILPEVIAYHTDLLKPVADKLKGWLEEMIPVLQPPTMQVFMNNTGEAFPAGTEPSKMFDAMCKQCHSTVHWELECQNMIKEGITELYEMGPGKQLKTMMKRIDQDTFKATKSMDC